MDATATSDTYRFGSFRLQARSGRLSRQDEHGSWMDFAIGSRSLDLLLLLLRRHGEILSRDEIMDPFGPGSASRDQVGSGPSCIQTISGRGYRFLPTVTTEVAVAATMDAAVVAHAAVPDPRRRLSIMVLPFKNLGDDANSDRLVGAITADLTTDLSRLGGAVVVAHAPVGTDETGLTDGRNMSAGPGACYRIEQYSGHCGRNAGERGN